jgi:tetratricopeptide (TPR) repeat protein
MSDLFVSYASEDRSYVQQLVLEFENQGWTVWWDRKLDVGVSFDKSIEAALDDALCIVVVWSVHSVASDWVRAEAAEGLERNVLVPVLLDEIKPPLLFRQKQAISLVEWKREGDGASQLAELIPSIESLLSHYKESSLPVSTQHSWVLGRTASFGVPEEYGNAIFTAFSLGLSFQHAAENDYASVMQSCLDSLEHDKEFLQANRALAIAYQYLGRQRESREAIARAIQETRLESPRNAVMARALYYSMYSEDFGKATQEFEKLVTLSPLDESAINNLAVCCFYELDFNRAKELSIRDLTLYPMKTLGWQNSAFYSLFDNDFAEADRLATKVLRENNAYVNSLVIRALVSAQSGDVEDARVLYNSGIDISLKHRSVMLQGLADLALAEKDYSLADSLLLQGVDIDSRLKNFEYHARKLLMRAELRLHEGKVDEGVEMIESAVDKSQSIATLGSAAVLFAMFGICPLNSVETLIKLRINSHALAYSKQIQGLREVHLGNLGQGIQLLNEAVGILDLWLIRFNRALVQKSAGLVLEAKDDFVNCQERSGESLSAALDEQPTFRYFSAAREFPC